MSESLSDAAGPEPGNDRDGVHRRGPPTPVQQASLRPATTNVDKVLAAVSWRSRPTRCRSQSGVERCPTRKLRANERFESAALELLAVLQLDRSRESLAYVDQPALRPPRGGSRQGGAS